MEKNTNDLYLSPINKIRYTDDTNIKYLNYKQDNKRLNEDINKNVSMKKYIKTKSNFGLQEEILKEINKNGNFINENAEK